MDGAFDWAAPDPEVFAFVNDLEREIGTYLYGRRMYETMAAWETPPTADQPAAMRDFAAIWRAADKVVYSATLGAPASERTRLEPAFDTGAVRRMKAAAERDLSVGGPTLAAAALRAGLVDELRLFLMPVAVGGGTSTLPQGTRLDLERVGERSFSAGTVFLRYRVRDRRLDGDPGTG